MSTQTVRTQTAQQYIVHLDIRATALDPSEAVKEALEQVMLGGLSQVAYRVEEVGSGREQLPADSCCTQGNVYRGEFLG